MRPVLFLSYCRFWEAHGFVQQSLARLLVESGGEVTWLDGAGWRFYRPVLPWRSTRLHVGQLPELPGRRWGWVRRLSLAWQVARVNRWLARNPDGIVWVQGGIDEGLADRIARIDVFSTFDDPYRHEATGPLARKSRLILCQNSLTAARFRGTWPGKAVIVPPPVGLPASWRRSERFIGTLRGKRPVAGYIGSFFSADFDRDLFEELVRARPGIDFILAGRTDAEGEAWAKRLSSVGNFRRLAWVPRESTPSLWRSLDASLLTYRENTSQDGAFAVKALESLHFGVPTAATSVAKTADLRDFLPRFASLDQWLSWLDEAVEGKRPVDPADARALEERLDPSRQLQSVLRWLEKDSFSLGRAPESATIRATLSK